MKEGLILLLLLKFAGSDLILNSVVLKDPAFFSVTQFETVLSAFSDSATVLSIQSDLLTGSVARRSYFPNNTDIHLFQLVHITRVQALVRTKNDTYTAARLYRSLGPACLNAGIGSVAIDSNTVADSSNAVMDWIASLPPLTIVVVIGGWILTASSCGVCWLVYCCCCRSKPSPVVTRVPLVQPVPSAPPLPPQDLDSQFVEPPPSNTAFTFKLSHPRIPMRLPVEMIQPQFSSQYGPYAAQTSSEGLSATHSASWRSGSVSARL